MPSILLNDNIHNPATQRGVSRYFQQIAEGVAARFGPEARWLSPRPAPAPLGRVPLLRVHRRRIRQPLHDLQVTLVAALLRPRVLFSPYYGNARPPVAQLFPVYDMIHERFPHYFDPAQPATQHFIDEKRRCLERADALLAISQATADDLLACYPYLDPAKIVVTPLGVDPLFFEATPPPAPTRPYLLFVGHRTLYKNFARLLDGFGRAALPNEIALHVISPVGAPFTPAERALLDRHALHERVHLLSGISDAALREQYAGALAFLYPSEYEGFGLPILEAMASGTLVATADRASMPEVGGPVAFYFDPTDPDAIAATLRQIVTLPAPTRAARIDQGIARAHTFSWARCQQQTNAVIQQFL